MALPSLVLAVMLLSTGLVPATAAAEDVDWVVNDTAPIERIVFAYAELPDGRIFISTGNDRNTSAITNETWLYDPYEKTWERVADCLNITESSTAVAMPNGKVYLFGGMYGYLNDHVLEYDVASDTWSYGVYLAEKVMIAEAVALDDRYILLAGGLTTPFLSDATEHCWIFDTVSGLFTPAADLPYGVYCGSMVVYGNTAYYFGGLDASMNAHDDVFGYSINGNYWYSVGSLPAPLLNSAVVMGSEGNVYLIGGESSFDWFSSGSDVAYVYNLFTGDVALLPELPSPVLNAAAFELSDGRIMYLLGNDGMESNTDVVTLQAWTAEAPLSSDTVDQGDSVWLNISVATNFMEMYGMSGVVHIVKDNVTYASYYIDSEGENDVALELAISEELPAGDYLVVLNSVNIGYGWEQEMPFEPLPLMVNEAPSADEQNQALQDELDYLQTQNTQLKMDLDAAKADLQDAIDAKLDAMIGYVILIVALGALIVGVIILVRKK